MPPIPRVPSRPSSGETIFSAVAGVWLALALLKFGNPVILDQQIVAPANRVELLVGPWPINWGFALFGAVVLCSVLVWRWSLPRPIGLCLLPLAWLAWQAVAATRTIDQTLTTATLKHFAVCTGSFYVGLLAFSKVLRPGIFWLALIGGFVVVMATGWQQHFGGLEETRRYLYSLPDWQKLPPELLQKASSNRIYATLFYPNALAGAVLLLLPLSLTQLWKLPIPRWARIASCSVLAGLGIGCLYWSGSKAGWLIGLIQGIVGLLNGRLNRAAKLAALIVIIGGGLIGFWFKYQGYFARGATSVSARFSYWNAAWRTLQASPLLGTGPGTFMRSYQELKSPNAEMTRLAHNDFLQQGSDSGWPGLITFAAFVAGSLTILYRNRLPLQWPIFGIWLGVLGIGLQSLVEFGLYIPALAWPTFFLIGFLLGRGEPPAKSNRQPQNRFLS